MKPIHTHKFPNGEKVDFKDCIHHTTTTKFPIIERIKHLFGAPVVVKSKIYCEHYPGYTLSEAKGLHTRLFPSRRVVKGEIISSDKDKDKQNRDDT